MRMYQEAGVPDGVINFVPGSGRQVGDPVLASPDLAGIHFTGSTGVFGACGAPSAIRFTKKYYPRIVGGRAARILSLRTIRPMSTSWSWQLRGAFEYQGQNVRQRRACTYRALSGRRSKPNIRPKSPKSRWVSRLISAISSAPLSTGAHTMTSRIHRRRQSRSRC